MHIVVHGAEGRMGRRICALAEDDDRFEVTARAGRATAPDHLAARDVACDVVVDFSSPEGLDGAVRIALDHAAALLVGTTGLATGNLRQLDEAARSIALMVAPNTALGVAVLAHLVGEAGRLLGPSFDVEIAERHHAGKRDAPSGTALMLGDVLRSRAGRTVPAERIRSSREGEIVGEHRVRFTDGRETLEIAHSALSRDLFAAGALRAAAWLAGQDPGRYAIANSLGAGLSAP